MSNVVGLKTRSYLVCGSRKAPQLAAQRITHNTRLIYKRPDSQCFRSFFYAPKSITTTGIGSFYSPHSSRLGNLSCVCNGGSDGDCQPQNGVRLPERLYTESALKSGCVIRNAHTNKPVVQVANGWSAPY
jgi:hypothetical protein